MKKQKWEEDGAERQEVRVLIENYEASVIIGKGGANVKQLRSDSNAFVSILRNESGSTERVLQVRGSVDCNAAALKMIAELMLRNDAERNADAEPKEIWAFKLLINKMLAGAIIGRGGEIIRAMQTETGAKVSVSTEPLGASTEKTVTVTGTPAVLHDVLIKILTQIAENPVKPGTDSSPYNPGQAPPQYGGGRFAMAPNPYGMPPAGGQYGGPPMSGQYGGPPMGGGMGGPPMGGGMGGPPMGGGMGGPPMGGGMSGGGGMGMGGGAPMGGGGMGSGSKTQKIVIPTVCAGTVIGKGGSIIREIKNQSGTNISLAAPEPTNPDDRVVTITGSEQGIQAAIYQIRQRIESFQAPAGY